MVYCIGLLASDLTMHFLEVDSLRVLLSGGRFLVGVLSWPTALGSEDAFFRSRLSEGIFSVGRLSEFIGSA
jgi:hypothetical protein